MLWAALPLVYGCMNSGQHTTVDPLIQRPIYEAQLREFLVAQRAAALAPLNVYPSSANWEFLSEILDTAKSVPTLGFPLDGDIAITDGVGLSDYRTCARFGPFSVQRPINEACMGDWLQNRSDQRSTGLSWFRLNWNDAPQANVSTSLNIVQPLAGVRVLSANINEVGNVAFVQNGSGVEAFSEDGKSQWVNSQLGLGEIIDIVDLDGDGSTEVIYSAKAGINPAHSSGTGPGVLYILSAKSGAIMWAHKFKGIEFGLNRYRTTIVNINGAKSKSILATMTYSSGLMRFDFDRGVHNGYLNWKSDSFDYDGPDKAPLVADLDSDGLSEIIVDSHGTLYAINATNGSIKGRASYASAPTFGGFLSYDDVDGDGRPEIVSVSSSVYFKGYSVFSWANGGFVLRKKHVWEQGLESGALQVDILDSVVGPRLGATSSLLVSITTGGVDELQLLDIITGAVRWRLPDHKLVYGLGASKSGYVATYQKNTANVIQFSDAGALVVRSAVGGRWLGSQPNRALAHSLRVAVFGGEGVLIDAAKDLSVASIGGAGSLIFTRISGLTGSENITAHLLNNNSILLSDGQVGYRVLGSGETERWFNHSARIFATPLVVDINGNGKRDVIAPFGGGLARFVELKGALEFVSEIFKSTPIQEREAFHIPIAINENGGVKRTVVGLENVISTDGVRQLRISARGADASLKWYAPVEPNNWERTIAAVSSKNAETNVAFRDSRTTMLLNGASGALIWTVGRVGQCQRQLASIDWNGDGVGDVVLQAGEESLIYDGVRGDVLWERTLIGSYGAYSSIAMSTDKKNSVLVQHNAGGLSLIGSRGLLKDDQIDERRIESLPVVVGRRALNESDSFFQITGAGDLRVFNIAGELVNSKSFAVPVVTMTGAYVDSDDAIDLLISTFDGQLIAVSGSSLKILWSVKLGAAVGTAVATNIDGGSQGAIVVITSDGRLHTLKP
jgi:hypothetical protein